MQPVDITKMKLSAIYFMKGITVVSGGLSVSSIESWIADKYPTIKACELKNGDVQLSHPNGSISVLSPWMISHRVYTAVTK